MAADRPLDPHPVDPSYLRKVDVAYARRSVALQLDPQIREQVRTQRARSGKPVPDDTRDHTRQ